MRGDTDDKVLDLNSGLPLSSLAAGVTVVGRVDSTKVFLRKVGERVRAFGVECPRLGASLEEGLIEDEIARCPWRRLSLERRPS